MLSRLKQTVGEKTGFSEMTVYPDDYIQGLSFAKEVKRFMRKFLADVKAQNQSYVSISWKRKLQNLTDSAKDLSKKLESCTPSYSSSLMQMAEAQKHLGALQKQFQKNVEEDVIAPLSEYMKIDFGRLKRGKSTVEQRRKEMDGPSTKPRTTTTGKPRRKCS